MGKTTKKVSAPVAGEAAAVDAPKSDSRVSLLSRLTADTARWQKAVAILFFIAVWALLGFCESSLLRRVESLSLFVFDTTFYNTIISVPAGGGPACLKHPARLLDILPEDARLLVYGAVGDNSLVVGNVGV